MRCRLQISSYRIDLRSVNGPISPKQCYYEMDYSLYSFYWLDSLEIWFDHNSTYYRSLPKNSDVKPSISHCNPQNLQYKAHPEFWPSHRRIFKTSLYYKMRLILETRRYFTLSQRLKFCQPFWAWTRTFCYCLKQAISKVIMTLAINIIYACLFTNRLPFSGFSQHDISSGAGDMELK